uniref:C2 domain-containing protein n=1 Tax=Sus scrofa TaxID=9823 RepID=A0A8D0N628_PIG
PGAWAAAAAAAAPRVVPAPCASKVELRLCRQHLLDRDPLTKSDPSVVLLLQAQSQWVQVDRTEVVRSSLHPMSAKAFTLHYYFEEAQRLRFEVCDTHGPGSLSCQASDFLGAMERTLGQVGPAPWEGGGWRGSRLVPRAAVAWGSLITPSLWSRDHRGPSREHPSSACLQAPLGKRLFSKKTLIFGVSLVAQWLMNATRTHEVRVRFLALLSGLRTQRCRELWCRLQMRLRSHIAVSLA